MCARFFPVLLLCACSENNLAYIGGDVLGVPGEPVADAGADRSGSVGEPVTVDGSKSYDPGGLDIVGYQWFLASSPSGSSSAPSLADTKKLTFEPDTVGTFEFQLTVGNVDDVWDSTPDGVVVEVGAGDAPVADAGPDAEHEPLDTVALDGSGSYDPGGLEPLTYAWSLVTAPTNSRATLDTPASASPRFVADLAGDYVFELAVTNTAGVADPTPDLVVITVVPADGFYVEASWDTNADIDLHLTSSLASGIFDCPHDCNFDNAAPSWFAPGALDDPSLDEDTIPGVSGLGPEIVTISEPSDDEYTVLVHYYGEGGFASCTGGCPATDVTVNVYLGGALAATYGSTVFDDDDVWTVATIEWPSGLVTEVDGFSATTTIDCF